MKPFLELRSITHGFGNHPLFFDLNLRAEAGEIITITGPSGCGKTTLLRLAGGLITPQSGSVERTVDQTGMAFQTPRLLPWRTALQNIMIPLLNRGCALPDAELCARSWLEKFGLSDAAEVWPGALSGGMAHRVSLARALAGEPDLLLLDEPLTGLDHESKTRVLRVLQDELTARKILCLYVTHDPQETAPFSTRSIALTA